VAVRTLQRFLESIRWDEERLRDRWLATGGHRACGPGGAGPDR
jgi:hypothetical protein